MGCYLTLTPQIVLRAFRPGTYPKHQLCSPRLPVQPLLAGGGCEPLGYFSTDSCGQVHVLFYFIFFQLCCHLRFQNYSQTRLSEVSYCLETSPPSLLPPQDGSLSLTLFCLLLSFIFCPTSFQREWAVFRDAWSPLPAFRSFFVFVFVFFCGSCSAFR